MPFKKGQITNPTGRKKGKPNKVTQDLRERIHVFLSDNFETVVKEWGKLESRDKLNFYRELVKYVVPALQSTDLNVKTEKPLQIICPGDAEKKELEKLG